MKTCMISVNVGDIVTYEGEPVKVSDFYLVPNGIKSPELVCIMVAKKTNGNTISATSNNFTPIDDQPYEECYPSLRMTYGPPKGQSIAPERLRMIAACLAALQLTQGTPGFATAPDELRALADAMDGKGDGTDWIKEMVTK